MTDIPQQPLQDPRFQELLTAVEKGEAGAAAAIVKEYGPVILRTVRRRMNQRLRDRFDSEDFAQAVWASFFGHISVLQKFGSADDLAGFLGRMACNKVIDAGRKRQVRSEQNSSDEEITNTTTDHRLQVSQPTPSQFAVANEHWHNLARGERDRIVRVLQLRRDGATHAEIAVAMGVSERHVRRILSRLSRKRTNGPDASN